MVKETEGVTTANGTVFRTTSLDAKKISVQQAVIVAKQLGFEVVGDMKEISHQVEADASARKITIPKSMSKLEAAKELEAQWKNEEQVIDVAADFQGWDWKDVLIAIKYVTEDVFGWIRGQSTFFGNPTEIDVVTNIVDGKPTTTKAFYGTFKVSAWENGQCSIGIRGGTVMMSLNCKKKFSEEVSSYYAAIRARLASDSIYRGKSIAVTRDGNGQLQFEIIENKSTDRIVLNDDEQLVVDNFILPSLSEAGKRCYLFTGSYGNGKTETAMKIGRIAVKKHGISFFYLKDSAAFDMLLERAKKYQPCIVFVEDIDEIAGGEQRDSSMNAILNTLDGVQTKGNNLTVIFTTNHAQRINTALRRPGRIDIVVEFKNPNKETAKRIMQDYFVELKGADKVDYKAIMDKFPDIQGAVIAEICKRTVKLYKNSGEITTTSILASLASMQYQIELMNGPTDKATKEEKFVGLLKDILKTDALMAGVEEIKSATC